MAERESRRIQLANSPSDFHADCRANAERDFVANFVPIARNGGSLAVSLAIFCPRTGISGGRLTPLIRICQLLKKLWGTGAAVISAVADINA